MGLPLFVTPAHNGTSPRPGDKETSNERTTIRRQRTARRGRTISSSERLRVRNGGRFSFQEPPSITSLMEESAAAALEERITRTTMEERWRRAQMQGAPVLIPSPWADRSTPPLPSMAENPAPRVMPPNPWGWNSQPDGPLLPPAPESPPLFAARAAWRSAPPTGYDRRVVIQRLYNDRAQARRARIAIAARNHPSRSIRLSVAEQNAFLEAQNELLNSLTEEQLMASDADPLGTPPPWMNSSILSQLRDEQSASVLPSASALPPSENNSAERRRFRLPRVDGLGDRERSLSPGGDGEWDTLLTTISPDPQPPSAGSSFASTSASDAASSVPTSTSSATSIGPPIEVDYGTSFENICEYVEANSPSSDPDEEEQEMLDFFDAREAGERFWRGYTDFVAARADRVARHASQADGESMGGMQRIVRRLARRQDIPDEWWAEVGLSRTIPRELVQS
ncbi:hypothetical protein VC83_03916 [Pseudogymnoascus destructans]|uniref:Uncharacterized protein n=1 Tax=Pseudogymnoascus destructans TaxID=655981 RepID=A0A177AE73_9PEZI|nr:uncharacterized protein VC83_03916 [Pseudogymnoascus destructans]OAF59483.1 hypothetical protein VC83_03916 [Pseudogymnoascus destructans]